MSEGNRPASAKHVVFGRYRKGREAGESSAEDSERKPQGGELVIKAHIIEFPGSAEERTRVYNEAGAVEKAELLNFVIRKSPEELSDPEVVAKIHQLGKIALPEKPKSASL